MLKEIKGNGEILRNIYLRDIAMGKKYGPMTGKGSIDKPWLKYYNINAIKTSIPNKTIYEYMKEQNIKRLHQIAIDYFGNRISYECLIKRIERVSSSFLKIGIKKGDVVTLSLANIPENIICIYALNNIGAIANLIDLRLKGDKLLNCINSANSSTIVVTNLFVNNLMEIVNKTSLNNIVVVSPANSCFLGISWKYKLQNKLMAVNIKKKIGCIVYDWQKFENMGKNYASKNIQSGKQDDEVCILHTSGTTGQSKGVVLTNRNFNSMVIQYSNSGLDFKPGDMFLSQVPPFLAYSALMALHLPLSLGLKVKMLPDYQPDKFAENILKIKPNHVIAGPADWTSFLKLDCKKIRRIKDLSFLRTMASGSDKISTSNKDKINEFIAQKGGKSKIIEGYGMTEMSSAAVTNLTHINIDESVGIPLPKTNICIYDNEKQQEVDYGETGEICLFGPTIMKAYFNDKQETSRVIKTHNDGKKWLHSGDIGYMSCDGVLYLEGRMKRVIIRYDGIKVSPFDIENVINKIEIVEAVCVVGINDIAHGQGAVPVANIVLKQDAKQDDLLVIKERCELELGEKYLPSYYVLKDQLPLTDVGKVDYRELSVQDAKELL